MKRITPVWAALALAAIAIFVAAWMCRYTPMTTSSVLMWDRWAQKACLASMSGNEKKLTCHGDM